MAGFAKLVLIGNLGKDPVLTSSSEQSKTYCDFSIATEEYAGKENGKAVYKTQWWNCRMYGQQAEYAAGNAKKGQTAYVEGNISINEKEGKTYINVKAVLFNLISRPERSASSGESVGGESIPAPAQTTPAAQTSSRGASAAGHSAQTSQAATQAAVAVADISEDDLPF
jgi:single stranded DNA-binding protein